MLVYGAFLNGEVIYVGQTVQMFCKRIGAHRASARQNKTWPFARAIKKYGINSISFRVLENANTQDELDFLERYYIKQYNPKYNLQEGGKSNIIPWNKGQKETREAVIQKIKKSAKTRLRTPRGQYSKTHIEKMSLGVQRACQKAFICLNNGVVYLNKVACAKDLNIDPRGISICLMPNTRLKTYKGYRFRYL